MIRTRHPSRSILLLSLVIATWVTVPADATQPSGTQPADTTPPGNMMCPVMPDEATDPSKFVDIDGQRVYFCCDRCIRKFKKTPGRYLAVLTTMRTNSQTMPAAAEADAEAFNPPQPTVNEACAPVAPEYATDQWELHEHDEAPFEDRTESAHEHPRHEHAVSSDHVHEEAPEQPVNIWKWLGGFHPAAVHFPIALLITAAVVEVLGLIGGSAVLRSAGGVMVWIGSIAAMVAGVLGWLFGGFHWTDSDWLMTVHRWVGTGTAVWAIPLMVFCARRERNARNRGFYFGALLLGTALVSAAGFLGGALIYGLDHFLWK